MKRILTCLLAMCLLLSAGVGCTPKDSGTDTSAGTPAPGTLPDTPPAVTDFDTETTPREESDTMSAIDTETAPPVDVEEPNTTPYPIDHLTIFGREVSEFAIVHADDASQNIQNAAAELANYIEKACGTRPVVKKASDSSGESEILVGPTDRDTKTVTETRDSLGYDGYFIHAEDGKLFLGGNSERTTFYAVYGLLEDYLGCRFYTTTVERILEKHEIDIASDLHYAITPRFFYRESGYGNRSRDPAFATKLRMNGCQWTLTGGGGTDNAAYYAGDFVHTLWKLCNQESHVIGWAPCLSDESVYETVLGNVRKTLDQNPTATFISVSINDCYVGQTGCKCDTCAAFNAEHKSDGATLMAFVNRIAREIKDEYPNVLVDTLAYHYTQTAPVGIQMEDNVVIRFCPMQACTCHTYAECSSDATETFMKDLAEWEKIADNLFVWYYSENTANFHVPYPNILPMREHFNRFAESKVQGFYFEGYGDAPNTDLMYLRIYMGSKLLWNPEMTEEEYNVILNDFLEGYYGAGWTYIREYMDRIDAGLYDNRHMKCGADPTKYLLFPGEKGMATMKEYLALWESAIAAAETEEHRAHAERDSISWMYYYLLKVGCNNEPDLALELVDRMRRHEATRTAYGPDIVKDPNFDPRNNSLWMITW